MAIEKFIIDKSDLAALLRGEDLAIQPRGNIRGFCVEIAGNVTNGDMLTALFGEKALITLDTHNYLKDWWNAPYNGGSEDKR